MTRSPRLSLFKILTATLAVANCGGPLNLSLSNPAEPTPPSFDKTKTVSECTSESGSNAQIGLKSTITYQDGVSKFLKANCTSCHKTGGELPDLSNYKSVREAAKYALKSLDEDSMPPKEKVAAKDKATFAAWVEGGMVESLPKSLKSTTKTSANSDDATACTTPKKSAKKSTTKPKIIDSDSASDKATDTPKNVSGSEPSPGSGPSPTSTTITYKNTIKLYLDTRCGACHGRAPVLTSYTNAKAAAVSSIAAMRGGNMPPGGKAAATDISNLQGWIDTGYPE